jgi:putative ABC transport system ATP-binding protein
MELLRDLAAKERSAVVAVSHDPRLHDVADRVLWLEDGRLREPQLVDGREEP